MWSYIEFCPMASHKGRFVLRSLSMCPCEANLPLRPGLSFPCHMSILGGRLPFGRDGFSGEPIARIVPRSRVASRKLRKESDLGCWNAASGCTSSRGRPTPST